MLRTLGATLLLFMGLSTGGAAQQADLDGVGYELGAPDAGTTVVEYGDFACGACGQFARDTWPTIKSEFIDTGLVRWKMVPFELGFRNSDEGARAGECAAEQDMFWPVHDQLYEEQAAWIGERRPKDRLIAIAVDAGVDEAAFRHCYDEKLGEDRTKAANRAARTDGIRGTPTFFVNGFQVQGALPIDAFRELLRQVEGVAPPGHR